MAASSAPSATRQCCQKSPNALLTHARPARRTTPPASQRPRSLTRRRPRSERRTRRPGAGRRTTRPRLGRPTSAGRAPAPRRRRPRRARRARARSASPRPGSRAGSSSSRRSGRRSSGRLRRRPRAPRRRLLRRAGPGDEPANRFLGGAIGLRHRREVGLRLDAKIARAKPPERDRVGSVGERAQTNIGSRPAT